MPVMLLTGLSGGEDRVKGLKLGANDYLVKPFEPEELVIRIERLIAAVPRPTTAAFPRLEKVVRGELEGEQVHLGRYLLQELIGEGAMGLVFRGWDPKLKRPVALKTIHFVREISDLRRRRLVQVLREEAVAAAQLSHPNVVAVHDVEDTPEAPFVAMEYIDGPPLDRYLGWYTRLEPDQVMPLGLAVACALRAAHERGMVHHDVKPANVLLGRQGAIKVADFGLSRAMCTVAEPSSEVWGTPGYLAPETLLGRGYTQSSDLFALGAVLFLCLTGRRPFAGQTIAETVERTLDTVPPRPQDLWNDVPEDLEHLVLQLLAKDPAARPVSAAEVVERLEAMASELNPRWAPVFKSEASRTTDDRTQSQMVPTSHRPE
jgi:serine/threonine-protein kinase